jgi:hypothetical protein
VKRHKVVQGKIIARWQNRDMLSGLLTWRAAIAAAMETVAAYTQTYDPEVAPLRYTVEDDHDHDRYYLIFSLNLFNFSPTIKPS